MRAWSVTLVLLAYGCTGSEPAPLEQAVPHATLAGVTDTSEVPQVEVSEVLAATDAERVSLVERGWSRYLRWEVQQDDDWKLVWESRSIYSADPAVLLEDFGGDGRKDLFWSIAFEEIAGAMFVFATETGPHELVSDVEHCSMPRIERVSGEYELRTTTAGVYVDCRDMNLPPCTQHFDTELPRSFRIVGRRLEEVVPSAEALGMLSEHLRSEATRAALLISQEETIPGSMHRYSDVCEEDFPEKLAALADSLPSLYR